MRDILSDYEDFFTSGEAEGKSEAELCEEFGPPEQAACELKSESETDTPRRGVNRSIFACALLAILLVVVLRPFFEREFPIVPGQDMTGPISFWSALLFPLVLQGILALWASQSAPPTKALDWIPHVNITFAIPVAVIFILFVYLAFTMPLAIKLFSTEGPFGFWHLLLTTAYYGSIVSELLLFASIILLMLYTVRKHEKARWFLFLDTTILVILLNLVSFVSHIGPNNTYDGTNEIAFCFLWGILPNLAAVGIYWAILKIISGRKVRREKAWTGR